ncbi:NHLP family bacteriocin export ABC transporter peptidase/permease/ATPase subunit [Propionivibrio sp.]|uniref:NHLP family bacteriocin export ABC transporter peptidase/permease/ATPase subunit n=1 Tax=Propionivibrio sp. TaxID=2212460 RepID=UPI003BF1FF32
MQQAATSAPEGFRLRQVKTPVILQMEAAECGAAALASILAFYGCWVPLNELRLQCGVSRDGSKASNVIKAARGYGLVARGFRKELAALSDLPLPMIVFWNFNHFLVVEGFTAEGVCLNDPAGGRRNASWEEFDQSFTGVVLTFETTPEFRPSGEPPSVLKALLSRVSGYKAAFAFLSLVGLTMVVPGLAIPAFSRIFVDDYMIGGQHSWLLPLVIGMTLTALLRGGLMAIEKHYLLRMESSISIATGSRLFWHMLHLPIEFYTQRYAGEIGSRLAISDRVAQMVSSELPAAGLNLVTALFFLSVMLSYDVALSLVSLSFAVANIWLLQSVAGQRKAANQRLAIDGGKVVGTSMNGLMLMETIKASGAESDFFEKWAGYQARWMMSTQAQARASLLLNTLPITLSAVEAAAIVGLGGFRVMDGAMTLGMLVAFQSLAQSFSGPVQSLVNLGSQIQQLQGDMDRLDDVQRVIPEIDTGLLSTTDMPQGNARLQGRIELCNVTFGYNRTAQPLINDFSLTVEPGQRIALVGPSGCGKSTVSKLLMGLYKPWSGEVLLDGQPRQFWVRDLLALSLAVVDQEIVLFEGSIRDNLTLWDGTVSDEALVRAATDACMHEAIVERPGGYDGPIDQGGRNFSGGQCQRLELARALVNEPRMLVLDEATSALDPVVEKEIDLNLRRRGCTCVIVAHRLSTVRDCDRIYVLQEGKIVEAGTHDELLAIPAGIYRRLAVSE